MATELSNLPSDPSIPTTNTAPQVPQNIKMETTAYRNDLDTKPTVPPVADPKQMTEMVSTLQNASKQGLTSLAEDIPKQTTHLTHDTQSVVDAIPEPTQNTNATPIDYIQNYATQEEISQQLSKQENKKDTMEYILEELKGPLLVAIAYFLFQSKPFQKFILSKFPSLFNDTGGFTSNGVLAISAFFGVIYYTGLKSVKHFSL